jgi:predicted transcriptional regulator
MNPREDISFLSGSDSRVQILRLLGEDRFRPTDIVDRVTCTRETVQRTLSGFRERGWVEKSDKHYHTTLAGDMVLESYDRLANVVSEVHKLNTFLLHAPGALRDLPAEVLETTRVTTATRDNPHAPINRYVELVGGDYIDRFRGITPIVSGIFNKASEAAIGPDTQMELVIDQEVLHRSRTDYEDALQLAYDLDQFTLYLHPEDITFGVAIIDDTVYLGSYDDNGNLVATIDGEDPRLYEWAEGVYEQFREASTEVSGATVEAQFGITSETDGGE